MNRTNLFFSKSPEKIASQVKLFSEAQGQIVRLGRTIQIREQLKFTSQTSRKALITFFYQTNQFQRPLKSSVLSLIGRKFSGKVFFFCLIGDQPISRTPFIASQANIGLATKNRVFLKRLLDVEEIFRKSADFQMNLVNYDILERLEPSKICKMP